MSYHYEDFLREQFLSPLFSGVDAGVFTNRLFQDRTAPWLTDSLVDAETQWTPAILVPAYTVDVPLFEPDVSWYTDEVSSEIPPTNEISAMWRGTTMESLFRDPVLTPVLDYMWDDYGALPQDSWHDVIGSDVGDDVVDVLGKRARSAWGKTTSLIKSGLKWGAKKVAAIAANPVVAVGSLAYDAVQIGNWTWKQWQEYQEFSAAFDAILAMHGVHTEKHPHRPRYYTESGPTRSESRERFLAMSVAEETPDFPYAAPLDGNVRAPVLMRLSDNQPFFG